jgi:hypothetical protein
MKFSTLEEALGHLYKALDTVRRLPLQEYDSSVVVGAMINIEVTIDSLETNSKRNTHESNTKF